MALGTPTLNQTAEAATEEARTLGAEYPTSLTSGR